ncbi:hypothetical protein HDU85_005231 [Gaertneriomyces sp. JEL0708]|nr:hypothetical protein HDU85_005231 [Gaertneriomyces sp. JEL0708]
MTDLKEASRTKCFEGYVVKYTHTSPTLSCEMTFSVYLPPSYVKSPKTPHPSLLYLSGLTCTPDNFLQKANAQQYASQHSLILLVPDTSPRNLNIPGEDDAYDLGTGAGFYLNATTDKWKPYQMRSYILDEFLPLVIKDLGLDEKRIGITGHSMGGHGALTIGLTNPDRFQSVSAFSPIVNPSQTPWGIKAFSNYLGEDNKEAWKQYDACELIKRYNGPERKLLVDQGTADQFLEKELKVERLQEACKENKAGKVTADVRMRDGYDHSYFFVATFIKDHIDFHLQHLKHN